MTSPTVPIDQFLQPLHVDVDGIYELSQLFLSNFDDLAAHSESQFLPTPISDSILRPVSISNKDAYHLAIDIGGTNLRVGFVQRLGKQAPSDGENGTPPRTRRLLEQHWSIDEHLKNDNAEKLFAWIGKCIATVVEEGCSQLEVSREKALDLGVTFSFPMEQTSLSEARLMTMGKGFAVSANVDLGSRLLDGYNNSRGDRLPPMRIAAIANDSVSTLVSFIYEFDESVKKRASMGLILGTGCNATIPLKLSQLKPSKRPANVSLLPGERVDDVKVAINTEWSINGSVPPLRKMNLISRWDEVVDSHNETPGFQPMEYMTAGRYLGELGRVVFVDFLTSVRGVPEKDIPERLLQPYGMSTSFLSHFKPLEPRLLLQQLEKAFPTDKGTHGISWTEELAVFLFKIAKAIEVRAAGIVAAATVALLTLGGELPQDYLTDCQSFIDQLLARIFGNGQSPAKVVLSPCHNGGVIGAGILVAAASASESAQV
ncbi:Hexokinase-like protein [Emericellopsis cladophorae]|uniref:Phosphotransferase n=1 Tax=Emericellopsis cladophorae TaxID=2686198 RepID=A0A9P9Y9E6_9HYPO|nr:Hexokinase-like protein [Emericellopsis cladophorae]KAI6785415.1 Hexokinase-like protein [Emericellopsis cladophorae]